MLPIPYSLSHKGTCPTGRTLVPNETFLTAYHMSISYLIGDKETNIIALSTAYTRIGNQTTEVNTICKVCMFTQSPIVIKVSDVKYVVS
jgi:hypothetical protein